MAGGGRPGLLAIAPVFAPALAEAETSCSVHRRWLLPDADAFLRDQGATIQVLATTGLRGFSASDLDGLPHLGHVACFGMGHGTFDLAAATARGITVSNTPDWTDEAVADVALGLMIGTMRRLCEADRFVRAGRWADGPFPMSTDLRGKTVGLIGLGSIGRAVARRVEGFGGHLPAGRRGSAHHLRGDEEESRLRQGDGQLHRLRADAEAGHGSSAR
jgi:lactate dehydrogenase-like 2-hydroxyacid dehydrogenase